MREAWNPDEDVRAFLCPERVQGEALRSRGEGR